MKKKFVMYSQFFEDWVLYCALQDVENGFYVDVGANDAYELSVTKAFYDRGWSGINIEPLKDKYDNLCANRPRDINLNIGAGASSGKLEFYIAGTGSTCEVEATKKFDKIKKTTIQIERLADILSEHVKDKNQAIHFCKIDVEGFERSVLEGMDFSTLRPWVMVLEAVVPGTLIPCHDRWEDLLFGNDYELAHIDTINRYYVDKRLDSERLEKLKSGFNSVWEIAGKYDLRTSDPNFSGNGIGEIARCWITALKSLPHVPGAVIRSLKARMGR